MVLSCHVTLVSLIMSSTLFSYFHTSMVGSYERHCLHLRMSTHLLSNTEVTIDHLQYSLRQVNISSTFSHQQGSRRSTFTRFQDKGIPTGQSNREHPQRNHGWEVERGYSCTHSQWHFISVSVNSLTHILLSLSHSQTSHSTSMF